MDIIRYDMLNSKYLCSKLPELKEKIFIENEYLGQNLPHSLYGNVLNPIVVALIKEDGYENNDLLKKIFEFYEQMAKYGDEEVRNLLQVTLLEYLWDDYVVYTRSMKLMGKNTLKINKEISNYLYVPESNDIT